MPYNLKMLLIIFVSTLVMYSAFGDVTRIFTNSHNPHPNWPLLPHGHCGETLNSSLAVRVMGGKDAYYGQYPWMANLFYTYDDVLTNKHRCGGSVISDRYILTAAHCCIDAQKIPKAKWVRVGEYNFNDSSRAYLGLVAPVQNIMVESVSAHEDYDPHHQKHDICVVRLTSQILFSEHVLPICLPTYKAFWRRTFDGSIMELSGWGRSDLYRTGKTPTLQTVAVPVLAAEECLKAYTDLDPQSQMCAGGQFGPSIVRGCKGDSGGPLMKQFEVKGSEPYFIFGITSFSKKNEDPEKHICDTPYPSVFTRVTRYIYWILDNIRP